MIRKPEGDERESKAHVAVGRAIEVGAELRNAGRHSARVGAFGCSALGLAMMAFGLLMSSTPLWFKTLGLILFGGAFYFLRTHGRSVSGPLSIRCGHATLADFAAFQATVQLRVC